MPVEGFSDVFYKGPAYALVIGIGTYEFGKPQGKELEPDQFPNLKKARQDATDFAAFLERNGFIEYNVRKLLDDEATLTAIKTELDELSKDCAKSGVENPLAIVYFSGHGWVDNKKRHYLIPYDGKRDNLPGSALPHRYFSDLLAELPTNRLVVFVDACHSGAIGLTNAKGAVLEYDAGVSLGEGEGRYLITSCKPGESSYELPEERNSIFTKHLLELLECENDDSTEVEVEFFALFTKLQKKVIDTAQRNDWNQTPTTSVSNATGIILAINKREREKRIQISAATRETRISFFEALKPILKNSTSSAKTIIAGTLKKYVQEGRRLGAPDDFFTMFDEYVAGWEVGSRVPEDCCELLIGEYAAPPPKAVRPKESNTQERPKPAESAPASAVSTKQVATETPQVPPSPALIVAGPQQEKRRLSPDDVKYVLEGIMKFEYYKEFTTLSEQLKWPVSEPEIVAAINAISSNASEPLRAILGSIINERLPERWRKAEIVESQSVANVILQKVKDV
ncbi:MAG: hypothetical protein QOK37_1283 [Thermoanaerobaculia bacterium]|jgi:hypothetical protein|nr:hypothetical protein [Thermoanaerobaculia bacterium]